MFNTNRGKGFYNCNRARWLCFGLKSSVWFIIRFAGSPPLIHSIELVWKDLPHINNAQGVWHKESVWIALNHVNDGYRLIMELNRLSITTNIVLWLTFAIRSCHPTKILVLSLFLYLAISAVFLPPSRFMQYKVLAYFSKFSNLMNSNQVLIFLAWSSS